jgi:hypothetical protein
MKKLLLFKHARKPVQKPLGTLRLAGSTLIPIYGFRASQGSTGSVERIVVGYWPNVKVF